MKKNKKWLLTVLTATIVMSVCAVTPAIAADVSVTRDLPDTASSGEVFEVSLTPSGFLELRGAPVGFVTEILPEGFEYRGCLGGVKCDEMANTLTIDFEGETTVIYVVKAAGTAGEFAVFSGTWETSDSDFNPINGPVGGETKLTLVEPTPTPTVTPTLPSPPIETPAYIHLNATPAEIPADGISTSTITASVWDGEKWVLENQTVNFNTSLGNINTSALIVNGTATGVLTAGTTPGIATIEAEANLSGDIGIANGTTTVNFTIPGATPTPTPEITPEGTPMVTPTPTATPTPSPTPSPAEGIPGFEGIFSIAGLFSVAFLAQRQRRKKNA